MNVINNLFKLKENETNVKTEILAGLTTFFTMSYLFILSPKILENTGLNFATTLTVTGLIVFLGCLYMGLIANKPYALAPFVGETAFISYTVVNSLGFSIKTAFAAILTSGLILLIMTIFNIRTYIVEKIPETIKISFCIGLGLFFIFISLKDMGIVNFTQNPIPLEVGNFTHLNVIMGLLCFSLIIIFVKRGLKAAVLLSIFITTILGILLGDIQIPSKIISIPNSISPSFMQLDFLGMINKNFIPMLFVIFLLINIDTAGAIVSLSYKFGKKEENLKKAMIADSLAVISSPILGTTASGVFLDSMTGIQAGGKTGLTAITVGVLFILGTLLTPILSIIPPYAYAPALLYVGILMTSSVLNIDFNDITEFAPAVFIISIMIFTYNIGIGIMAGFIIYPLIKVLCGQKQKTNIITWIMFVLSIIFFIIYPY